jgi:hypothetical protein
MPRTNEYGLASALDLPQTNECRAYRCPRGPRSIRVRALVDQGVLGFVPSWTKEY